MLNRTSFTVLGAFGLIGSHLVTYLKKHGENVYAPTRSEMDDGSYLEKELAHVFYCIGVTADFRSRPIDTVSAHVSKLLEVIKFGKFESLIYLSSARIYQNSRMTSENQRFTVDPALFDHLYDISKLMGESLCLSIQGKNTRIVRLSNVVGAGDKSENFLNAIIQNAVTKKHVTLKTTLNSSKDYVSIDDVVSILPEIAKHGKYRIYNLGYGVNITNKTLISRISEITGSTYDVEVGARQMIFPQISIKHLRDEFQYNPVNVLDKLDEIVHEFKKGC